MRTSALLFSAVIIQLLGCTRFESRVTTYLSHDLSFPAYDETNTVGVVARADPAEPLLEQEVARKIEILLRERGYTTRPVGEARYVLFAYFAIDSGQTVSGTQNVYIPGGTAYTNVYTSSGQWATATTRLPGHTEQRSYSYTYFSRYLGATLYDHQRFIAASDKDKDEAVVWRGITTSTGNSSDLRSVIDYLLVATFKHFGADTGKQVREALGASDKRVRQLRDRASKSTTSEIAD
jgi:hypothetical protein